MILVNYFPNVVKIYIFLLPLFFTTVRSSTGYDMSSVCP